MTTLARCRLAAAGPGRYTGTVEHFDQNWRALQLESLVDFSLWAGGFHSLEELIEELLRRSVGSLDARMGLVASLDEQDNEDLMHSVGMPNPTPTLSEISGSMPSIVFSDSAIFRSRRQGPAPSEILAAPLKWRDHLLGYVLLGDKETRDGDLKFSDSDGRYLMALAAVTANAMATSLHLAEIEREKLQLEEENRSLRQLSRNEGFIGSSPPVLKMLQLIARVAPTDVSIMFRGESGSGKERVARIAHASSSRSSGPFIALNCAALPETLLEAELFGIEEGVATGVRQRPGKLELAQGGTLFLDEIGDLSLPLQAKLLRMVQEREFEHLGGRQSIPFDARLITATHQDLEEMVEQGSFRSDLYYRLRVVVVEVSPLRERLTDIPLLTRHFLEKFSREFGRPDLHLSREAIRALMSHPFPGNIRELENRLQAAVAMATEHQEIGVEDLGLEQGPTSGSSAALPRTLIEIEREHIERILRLTEGRKIQAARILGIDRTTLYRKLRLFASSDG